MSKRFGRNQKRRLREEIKALHDECDALRGLLFSEIDKSIEQANARLEADARRMLPDIVGGTLATYGDEQAAESEPLCRPLESSDDEQGWLG